MHRVASLEVKYAEMHDTIVALRDKIKELQREVFVLRKGLDEIRQVADISDKSQFYAMMANKALNGELYIDEEEIK